MGRATTRCLRAPGRNRHAMAIINTRSQAPFVLWVYHSIKLESSALASDTGLINRIVDQLRKARHDWREGQGRDLELGSRELPSHQAVHQAVDCLCGVLFPMRLGPPDLTKEREDQYVAYQLGRVQSMLTAQATLELV